MLTRELDIDRPLISQPEEVIDYFFYRQKKHNAYVAEIINLLWVIVPETHQMALKIEQHTHDASKFTPDEMAPYAFLTAVCAKPGALPYIYIPKSQERFDKIVGRAWNHHCGNNRHHPEFWGFCGRFWGMPLEYVSCMIADWAAMSLEFNNSLLDWANKTLSKNQFSEEASQFIIGTVGDLIEFHPGLRKLEKPKKIAEERQFT
jgi:hypothetical protein